MDCPSCGEANRAGRRFCARCGAPLVLACAACGGSNDPGEAFCGECGARLTGSESTESRARLPTPEQPPAHPMAFAGGRYQVIRFLGEGGKKRVYLAHDTLLDREVAFGLIKTDGLDEAGRERVRREAQALGRLGSHPHIVSVYDLGEHSSSSDGSGQAAQPYLVTEHMEGGDLQGLIDRAPNHRLPLDQAVRIGQAVSRALEFAHAKNLIHRDLKPGNVWLTADGTPKLGDFGLAVALDQSRLTQPGMMVGTAAYMSPEQATGAHVDARSDLYALGAMLYEMVCGRPPFLAEESAAIVAQHVSAPAVAPSWHRPGVPAPLESLILRLLAKDPKERPQSAGEVLNGLGAIEPAVGGEQSAIVADEARVTDGLAGGVFVGRQREMGLLKAALEDALRGRGRLVMLVGEPGIGKTRTAQEIAAFAELRRTHVIWGRCYAGQGAPPYWPWVQAIRSYLHDHVPERVRSEMGVGAADIAEIVSEVREQFTDLKPPPALDPAQARFRLFDSIASFLKSAARAQPIVLILGNLHWADKPSLLLLEFLARELEGARLLVIGTYRDTELSRRHPLAQTLGELAREGPLQRVRLQGLSRQDVGRFIELTGGIEPPEGLIAAVHGRTEGNPLFVTEVVQLLMDEGKLATGQSRSERNWSAGIPEGVREVVGRRLDRLSRRCNQALTIASVIGREFRIDQLQRLMDDAPRERLLDAVEEALAAGVIQEGPQRAGRYLFTNALIQQTLASELSTTQRTRLHAQIGDVLEELYGADAETHAGELAHHFGEAASLVGSEKLVRYSLLAGDRALATYAYEEALNLFERALTAKEGQPVDGETAALLFGRGRAQGILGQGDEALASLTRAFDYYAQVGDLPRAVAVAENPVPHLPGQVQRASQLLSRALDLVPPDSLEAGRLLSLYCSTLGIDDGDYEGAQQASARALAIARREKNEALEIQALARACAVDGYHLRLREGLEKSLQVIELSQRLDDPVSEASSHFFAALALWSTGEIDRARTHAAACLAVTERLRDRFWQGSALWANEIVCRLRGDFRNACAFNDRGLALLPNDPRLLGTRALMDFEMGEVDQGKAHVERLLEAMRLTAQGPAFEFAFVASIMPPIARISGVAEWLDVAERAAHTTLASSSVTPLVAIRAKTGLAWLAVVRGDASAAAERYAELESRRGTMTPGGMFSVDHVLGLLTLTQGHFEQAKAHFEDALALCRRAGYRPEHGWVACDYAGALLKRDESGDREQAGHLLDEALAISRELGMQPLGEHILRHGEKLGGAIVPPEVASAATSAIGRSSIEAVASVVGRERPDLRSHAAPDGTVTILFSDIEGYTAMTTRLGDVRGQDVLHVHNTLVRRAIAAHGGFEVKSQGDSFMVAFASARRALQCAIAIQRAMVADEELAAEGMRLRIGLHTGEAIKEGEDFYGTSVILAARIAARAQGGQILVSELLRGLVGSLAEVELRDAGRKKLKGLPGRQRVYQAVWG